jgi:hypothetical protein
VTASGSVLSALDAVLYRARDLLLDFDGVVIRLYRPAAEARTADWLRARLADPATGYDGPPPRLADPAVMLSSCEVTGASGRRLECELAGHEFAAASTAQLTGSAAELIAGARRSGRTVSVITSCAARVADDYLDRASLAALTGPAIGRRTGKPASGEPGTVLARCARRHWPHRGTCAVISARPDLLNAASEAQIPAIRFDPDPGQPGSLPGHLLTVTSLDSLVHWLRTRPLA